MMTNAPLRVLLVEDQLHDAQLILRAVSKIGRAILDHRVMDADSLRHVITTQTWDVVISDWSLPSFSALEALAIVRELDIDTPFIIVSGTIGEERAVEAMRAGAHDYLLKGNLARLAPAVEREVREAAERARLRVAESELWRQEARFRALIEKSTDVVCVVGKDGLIQYMSPSSNAVLGRDADSLIGHPASLHAHPDDAASLDAFLHRVLDAPGSSDVVEYRICLPDGTQRWVHAGATNRCDEPAIDGLVLHLCDVDPHRRALEQLRITEARYRQIVETTSEGVWTLDKSGHTTFVNRRLAEMLGRTPAEIMGRRSVEFLDEADRTAGEMHFAKTRANSNWNSEVRLTRPDGTHVRVQVESTAVHDPTGEFSGLLCMLRDVTRLRTTETAKRLAEDALARTDQQLRHAQKMEAVGRLAGGVAHDFNNLLSVILSYSSMLLEDLAADSEAAADLAEICNAGKRAAELTHQLLAFSRQQVVEPRVIDINAVVIGMDRMCQRILGEDIELQTRLAGEVCRALIDPSAFEQVIMNLVVNARDAMPSGGKLSIETARVLLDAEFAGRHLGVVPGPHVRITVTDSGTGLDVQTMQHIFEPFFTTKETGKGTGLGLSTVFGIVRQAGGTIWVTSELGVGTCFEVLLPSVDQAPTTRRAGLVISDLRGTETVLVVEDEDAVRGVARGILQRNGYEVIEARSPHEALELPHEQLDTIDLLLTDIVMPGMSGPELARRLRGYRPSLKVLCMSGYTDEAVIQHGLIDAGLAFMQKPLLPDALLRKVRETLEHRD